MLLGYVADTHIRGEDKSYGSDALAEALEIMKSEGVSRVICAGDVFEAPSISDKYAMTGTLVRAFLDPVEEYGIPWDLIEGNHDQAPASEKGALAALAASPLCNVISGDVATTTYADGTKIAYLPWLDKAIALAGDPSRDRKDHQELFRQYSMEKISRIKEFFSDHPGTKVLVGHCEVLGAVGGAYRYVIPGSSFWFQCPDLLGTGADVIALGHIHYRQRLNLEGDDQWLGYIGSLRPLNFGERDNPSGFMLHDTSTNEIRFVGTMRSPRYFVVSTEEASSPAFLGKVRPEDRVRVTGLTRPEGIPSYWDFVSTRVSQRQSSQPRGTSLAPNASVMETLEEWLRETNNYDMRDRVMPYAEKLISEFDSPEMGGHGGIEEVCQISLEGIDRHPKTVLNTEGIGRMAVLGENGSGKSTLIGAVYACLYGDWPAECRGSLYDMMTGDQAQLSVVFKSSGKTYKAQRILEKTGTKTEPPVALLLEIGPGGEETALAGPKVRLFESKVEQLLGHKDIVLGSVFYTQDGTGDLVTSKKGARKDWIRRFLGLGRYDPCAKAATDRYKAAERTILRAETTLDSIPSLKSELKEVLSRQKDISSKFGPLKDRITALEMQHKAAQESLDDARRTNAARDGLLHRLSLLERDAAASRGRLDMLHAAASRHADSIPKDYSEEVLRGITEECATLRKRLDAARESKDKYDKVMRYYARIRVEMEALKARLADASKRSSLLDRVGCRDNPLPCPLIQDAIAAQADIPGLEKELQVMEKSISKCQSYAKPAGYESIVEMLRDAERRKSEYSGVSSAMTHIRSYEESIEKENTVLSRILLEMGDLSVKIGESPYIEEGPIVAEIQRITADVSSLRNAHYLPLRDDLVKLGALKDKLTEQLKNALEVERDIVSVREAFEAYRLLAGAFGRDGIPQLLISHAIPEIQHYMDAICEEDFDSRYRVRFNTQKEHKNGVVEETFDILFSYPESDKEYDAASCSGGELAAVRVILRAALGLYQASRAQGHKVAFLDEFTAHQDARNSESSLRVLSRLQDRFSQIFFVTFDHLLLPSFPHRVFLSRNGAPRCQSA